jgi:hypothetical protein
LQVSPVKYLRRVFLHLSYSIDFDHVIVVIQGTHLHLTARQLREFALPGAIHRLIVPVVTMELSRWAARYGAIFACPTGVSRAGNHGELKELK